MVRISLKAGGGAAHWAAFAGSIALAVSVAASGAAAAEATAPGMAFDPPPLNKLKCEKTLPPPQTSRDWKSWQGDAANMAPRDLLAVGQAYLNGTDNLDPDPAIARRIFQKLAAGRSEATAQAREGLAQIVLSSSTDRAELDGAIKQLQQAVNERDIGAAISLGRFYELGGPVARDPAKALAYYRIGATAGEPQAILGIARLAKAGAVPGFSAADADNAARIAVIALVTDVGRGNCGSLYWLGRLYDSGDIVPLDEARAARWYEAAARTIAHSKAAEKLAKKYAKGHGVEMSLPKMVEFLEIAAKGGRPRAMENLGEAHALGDGTPRDSVKAVSWFEKAEKAGQAAALRWLARAWRGEFGGKPDPAKSFAYLVRDAERPAADRKTFFELGNDYLDGTGTKVDVAAGVAALERAAALGHKDAAQVLGDVFLAGRGLPADPLKAARYFRQAAAFGNVDAMTALSDMHKCGLGIEWSPVLAARWSERAAFVGSGSSLYAIAMAMPPPAAPDDQAHLFRLLRRAAALGSRPAMVRLAIAYERGIGVSADQRLADDWRSRALAPGDYSYQGYVALAAAYGDGNGVPRDVAKARDLLRQGAEAGNAQVEYMLSRFLADHGGGSVDEAREAIQAAAAGGNATAMRTLAGRLGYGVSAGGKDRQGWLTAAAGAGDVRAKIALARQVGDDPAAGEARLDAVVKDGVCESDQMADLAVAYFALRTDTAKRKAAAWLDRAVAIGSPDHQVTYVLGQALASGIAGADLQPKGLALLTEAAEAGMVKAMRQLATFYQSGSFGSVDNALATQWLERAAAAGDAGSAVDFARRAASGGSPADLQKAHDYLAKAAEASANAARQLGQLSIQGLFGPAAQAEGTEWLRKAAEGGDVTGMLALSDLYASGAGSLPRDPAQSLEWLRRAAVGGDAKAMFKLAAAYEAGFGTATDTVLADQWYQRARNAGLSETGK